MIDRNNGYSYRYRTLKALIEFVESLFVFVFSAWAPMRCVLSFHCVIVFVKIFRLLEVLFILGCFCVPLNSI